jgi:translation initiation factor 5B
VLRDLRDARRIEEEERIAAEEARKKEEEKQRRKEKEKVTDLFTALELTNAQCLPLL